HGERPIIRSDGTPLRDYVYAHDAALAYMAISAAMLQSNKLDGQSFNISNDEPVSVLQIVALIQDLIGRSDLKPQIENTATLEIQAQYLNSSKLRLAVGWQPRYTLTEGLRETIAWYRDYLNGSGSQTEQNESPGHRTGVLVEGS